MSSTYPEIYIQFLASILITLLLLGSLITILLTYQKKKILQEKRLELLQVNYEKSLLRTQLEIQEEVHKQISMEIHDNVGQCLLLANINNTILQSLSLPESARNIVLENKQLLSKATEDITEFSRSLHSKRILDIGVFKLIRQDLAQLEFKGLYKVSFNNDSLEDIHLLIPDEAHFILYRMFQEIIKNIIKHANATQIIADLKTEKGKTILTISDNGKGFTTEVTEKNGQGGLGIRSLQDRIQLIGGSIRIDSELTKGTSISILIPHIVKSQK